MPAPYSNRWMFGLIAGLMAWALFLALGTYLGGEKLAHDPQHGLMRGLTVVGAMALFVLFWLAMLATRKPRQPGS